MSEAESEDVAVTSSATSEKVMPLILIQKVPTPSTDCSKRVAVPEKYDNAPPESTPEKDEAPRASDAPPVLTVEEVSHNKREDTPSKVKENSERSPKATYDSGVAAGKRLHGLECTGGVDSESTPSENR